MHELYFLCRQFRWELAYRIVSTLVSTFLGLVVFGMVLADTLPDWLKSFGWLRSFTTALRELPPWDFILIAFTIALLSGYLQRITTYFFRRRNTRSLGKVTLRELEDGSDGKTLSQRRRHMVERSRLLSMVFRMGSAVGAVIGVIGALVLFGYYPSAIILTVLIVAALLYLPFAVSRWLAGFEKNEQDHEALRKELEDSGSGQDAAEIGVHADRLRIRAKLPLLRLTVVWPLLALVLPAVHAANAHRGREPVQSDCANPHARSD
jgi:ABC-type siderophore export system fused ATPase/permease subunit